MKNSPASPDAFTSDREPVTVDARDLEFLKGRVGASARARVRFCAHGSSEDAIHEMLIVLAADSYVRPHKHSEKIESFHIVEGALDVLIFDDAGRVDKIIEMGDVSSGKAFFYRMARQRFHSVVVRSRLAIVHETTGGPFRKDSTIYAPWAPEESEPELGRRYLADVLRSRR